MAHNRSRGNASPVCSLSGAKAASQLPLPMYSSTEQLGLFSSAIITRVRLHTVCPIAHGTASCGCTHLCACTQNKRLQVHAVAALMAQIASSAHPQWLPLGAQPLCLTSQLRTVQGCTGGAVRHKLRLLHPRLLLLLLLVLLRQRQRRQLLRYSGQRFVQSLQLCHNAPEAWPILGSARPAAAGQRDIPGGGPLRELRPHTVTDDGLQHLAAACH